jgi:hypothetical protein
MKPISQVIKDKGKSYPKKHGEWYVATSRLGDFVLDTWNGQVYFYPDGATPSKKDTSGGIVRWYGDCHKFQTIN